MQDAELLERRLERERQARSAAEALLESKSSELYDANQRLAALADELEAQTKPMNAIFERSAAGILLVDEDSRVSRANPAAERMLKAEPKALRGESVVELFDEGQRLLIEELAAAAEEPASLGDEDMVQETTGLKRNGETFPVEVAVAGVELEGRPHSIWICRDLTRLRKEEALRADLESELSQAQKLESLGTLASGIAHEINTPVQYVNDNTHFLKDAFLDLAKLTEAYRATVNSLNKSANRENAIAAVRRLEEAVDIAFLKDEIPVAIQQTLDGIQHISKIVNAIKSFSHPGGSEMTPTDLNDAIETTVTVTRNSWKYVAKLETRLDPNLPNVCCLPAEINQVLLNLIVNAAQAVEMREGQQDSEGLITVESESRGDEVEIRVRDNGCGIAEEHRSSIFDPFFTTKEVGKGTGQGLSIVHGIVTNLHHGKIFFETEVGVGTTFFVRLPVSDQAARPASAA